MLRDHWYIACASTLLSSTPHHTRVLDEDLVVFRDSAGKARALMDQCCHRGAPLSLGSVVDGTLVCAYHGWRFDGTGACVHIPSLTIDRPIPKGCEVPSFPCVEQDAYVWVWMGDPADARHPPFIPGFAECGWEQGTKERLCASLRSLENTLDWCHPPFVHAGSHPQARRIEERGFEERAYEMRVHDTGMVVFAPPVADDEEAIPPDAQLVIRFDLPDRVSVHRPRADLRVVMHFIPTSAATCRMEWLVHHPGLADTGVVRSDAEGEIFEQDRIILEAVQRRLDRTNKPFERSVEADAGPLMLRRIIELAEEGRWEAERSLLRKRRIVPVRA